MADRAPRRCWDLEADELARALKVPSAKGNERYQLVEDVGLGFLNRNGKVTDAFRSRILFPIFDVNGEPVAFGGRVLKLGQNRLAGAAMAGAVQAADGFDQGSVGAVGS